MQPPPNSKLFIRSEVLAVVEFFTTVEAPPKEDKLKQLKRLSEIDDQQTVQRILVKELVRAGKSPSLPIITELLMELGDIEILKEPLWQLIESRDVRDEVKDAANLILRQLGDQSDPSLYLDYLEDPEGLISRETERMLEVAARNPEALIDFIDFIFSLPVDEQCHLIRSLQADYAPDHLVNIYVPTLEANPPYELKELILGSLGETRSALASLYLNGALNNPNSGVYQDERLRKLAQKSLNELKMAGVYRDDQLALLHSALAASPHPLIEESVIFECYATIPDGIGNQGLIISRKKDNGDVAMMSVAVNDIHGIMDCFGFYELSEGDFHKIAKKFHEECSKTMVPAGYCLDRLRYCETLNRQRDFRIPYEYTCWKVLLDDLKTPNADWRPLDLLAQCGLWARPEWHKETPNLYLHPDFMTWFLEEGDHDVVTEMLETVKATLKTASTEQDPGDPAALSAFEAEMARLAETMMARLLQSDWRDLLIDRLANTAYLLYHQQAQTFASFAATEVQRLVEAPLSEETLRKGFTGHFGKRSVEECLLRCKLEQKSLEQIIPWVDHVLQAWSVKWEAAPGGSPPA